MDSSQVLEQERAEGSLFSTSGISLHLRELNYPEKSIFSMLRCGESSSNIVFMHCGCTSKAIPLKHHCDLRTCPECAKFRKRRLRKRYFPFLSGVHQDRTNFLYFLTISPKNYVSLEEGLFKIRKNFNKFLRLQYVKERVKAGLYVIESKQSLDGSWNIHIHCIVYGRFMDNRMRGACLDCGQHLMKFDFENKFFYCASKHCLSKNVLVKEDSKLVSLWKKSSKEEVNVHVSKQGSSIFTLNYMLKYISSDKGDFQNVESMARYIVATRKMKLISTFGLFYKAKFQKIKPICLNCGEEINFIFDLELMSLYRKQIEKIPDPPDLTFWIEN